MWVLWLLLVCVPWVWGEVTGPDIEGLKESIKAALLPDTSAPGYTDIEAAMNPTGDQERFPNPFIIHYYRHSQSPTESFESIFKLHNEIFEIWTHIIAAGLFFVLLCLLWERKRPESIKDRWIISCYLIAVLFACIASVLYHTGKDARTGHNFFFILDCSGILILCNSAALTVFYYGLRDRKEKICSISYFGLFSGIAVISTISGIIYLSSLDRAFIHHSLYFIGGVVASVTIQMLMQMFVLFIMNKWSYLSECGIEYYIAGLVCLTLGFLFYVTRFPERLMPGDIMDIYFHSHHWWHLFGGAASFLHYLFLLKWTSHTDRRSEGQ